jgi:hypothetical protein
MESFVISSNGKDASKYGNKLFTSNEVTSFRGNGERTLSKWKSINTYERWKWCHASSQSSITDSKDQVCLSPNKPNPTHTQPNLNDNTPTSVISVEAVAYCMGTKVRTVPSPINGAIPWPWGDAWCPSTTTVTTRLLMPQKPAPTKATTKGFLSVASMPEQLRLNNENGPDVFGRDSPVRRMGHWSDRIGAAGSATEAEMEWRMGSGVLFTKNSRPDFPSRTGSRLWTGGDDTILTPFSLSPMTDMVVDSLPALFLDYCTIANSDNVVSISDWLRLGHWPWAYSLSLSL